MVGPLERNPAPIHAKRWPWLRVHLDARGINNRLMLGEAKWTNKADASLTERPSYYYTQQQLQMLAVADAEDLDVSKMVNVLGMKVRHKEPQFEVVKPDPDMLAKLEVCLARFGEAVAKRERPEPIEDPNQDVEIEASDQVIEYFEKIRRLQNEQDMIAGEIDALKGKIRDRMGDADVLMLDGHALAYNRLSAPTRFNGKAFKAEHPALHEEFSSTKEPVRVFRLAPRRKQR